MTDADPAQLCDAPTLAAGAPGQAALRRQEKPVRFWHVAVVVVLGSALALGLAALVFQYAWHLFTFHRRSGIFDVVEILRITTFYKVNIACVVAYGAYAAVIWWMARLTRPAPLRSYFAPVSCRTVVWSLVGGAGMMAVMSAFIWTVKHYTGIDLAPDTVTDRQAMPANLVELPLAIVSIVIVGPFAEEFFFRGLFLSWLRRRAGIVWAIAISSVLFSLMHGTFFLAPGLAGWFGFADILLAGVVLAILAVRTSSLWPGFAFHAANNCAIVIAAMLPWPK